MVGWTNHQAFQQETEGTQMGISTTAKSSPEHLQSSYSVQSRIWFFTNPMLLFLCHGTAVSSNTQYLSLVFF